MDSGIVRRYQYKVVTDSEISFRTMLIRNLERKIGRIEDFDVNFLHPSGSDVNGNKDIGGDYDYEYKAKGEYTVSEWTDKRFKENFPGYDVEVLDGDGAAVTGHMKLATVRSSY